MFSQNKSGETDVFRNRIYQLQIRNQHHTYNHKTKLTTRYGTINFFYHFANNKGKMTALCWQKKIQL